MVPTASTLSASRATASTSTLLSRFHQAPTVSLPPRRASVAASLVSASWTTGSIALPRQLGQPASKRDCAMSARPREMLSICRSTKRNQNRR